jgi:predicted nucleic acid-binding protein
VTLVVEASVVVAALGDAGAAGDWARSILYREDLAAPHMMPAEVANVLHRQVHRGRLTASAATLAHAELAELSVDLYPYAVANRRVWELRSNLNAYDAWYVALAELLGVPLVTLDRRLALASGPRCEFRVPRPADTIETGME